MTAEQFAYWMQGFSELTGDEMPTPAQWKMMKEHLATVFVKVTPPLNADPIDPSKVPPMRQHIPSPDRDFGVLYDWRTTTAPVHPLIATRTAGPNAIAAQTTC